MNKLLSLSDIEDALHFNGRPRHEREKASWLECLVHVSVVTYSRATDSFQFLYLEIKGGPDDLIAAVSRVGDVCAVWGTGGGSLGQVPKC